MIFRLSFFCLLFFTNIALSQKIKLIDYKTQKPIENVYIFTTNNSTLTDATGVAELSNFSKTDTLHFQHPSYANLKIGFDQLSKLAYTVNLHSTLFPIQEIVVSANKWEQKLDELPLKIIRLEEEEIRNNSSQTTADLLKSTNQVYIQKSQLGGGSPMIRGFAANRVLISLDGIRLNNAIYRSGNLQNVINIDPNSLESVEVILGPGSIIYGSDAIGGVMDFHTLKPRFSTSTSAYSTFSFKSRYSSANREIMNHAKYNFGKSKFSMAGSISYSDFSDLEMGSHGPDDYLRREYVSKRNGQDQITINSNPEKQIKSGYSQLNLLQKFRWKFSPGIEILYNFQYSKTSNVPRYDRLIQYAGNQLKYAEWYYGPQKLQVHSLQLSNTQPTAFYNSYKLNASYQNYQESRHSRKFESNSLQNRFENVQVYAINADAEKEITSKLHLFYGSEWSTNKVHSKANSKNSSTNQTTAIASRYPDDSNYSSLAFYSNIKWKINKKWILNSGIRYSHIWIKSNLDDTFYNFPFENLNLSTGAFNGGLGLSYKANNGYHLKLNATTGFRAPNIDDVGKVFDSEPGKVVVPNKDLKPEYIYNFEANLSKNFSEFFYVEAGVFYSFLDQAMVRDTYTFNGKSTLIYDGVESEVQAIVNTDNAKIWGGSISSVLKINNLFSVHSSINYTQGEYKNGTPIRHVPPVFGNASLEYNSNKFSSTIAMEFNGEISYKNLANSERDKTYLYAKDKNGNPYSPQWTIFHFTNQYQFNQKLSINVSIENLFDKRYRPYSSGISSPGRNFILSLSYTSNANQGLNGQ